MRAAPRRVCGPGRGAGDQRQPRPGLRLLRSGPRLAGAGRADRARPGLPDRGVGGGCRRHPPGRDPPDHPLGAGRVWPTSGSSVTGLRLRCHNTIPHGRGLGSSSAAIVAGLVAAAGLAGEPPDPELAAAARHRDRGASRQRGGGDLRRVRAGVRGPGIGRRWPRAGSTRRSAPRSSFPGTRWSTNAARGLLPGRCRMWMPRPTPGRAALLVHALAGDPDRLYDATQDWLHQGYREPAMPRSYELVKSLRGQGFAAVISGAGPSVLVLGRRRGPGRAGRVSGRRVRAPAQRDRGRGSSGRGRPWVGFHPGRANWRAIGNQVLAFECRMVSGPAVTGSPRVEPGPAATDQAAPRFRRDADASQASSPSPTSHSRSSRRMRI